MIKSPRKGVTYLEAVAGSTPAGYATVFRGDLIIKYFFYSHSLSSADSRRAVVSFWQKNEHNTG